MSNADEDWFERIWEHREEVIYPRLFGTESEGIFPIPARHVSDPRWSTCGVIRYAPTPRRQSWLYVSSGLSNAWFDEAPDPSGVSGFGCEFVMEIPEKANWPIVRLHQIMKYQIDLCCGKHEGSEPLSDYHRIPLGSAIDFAESKLTFLILSPPVSFPQELRQDSGSADFLLAFGITEAERDFAREHGSDVLLASLQNETNFPVTDSSRSSTKAPLP